MHKKLLWTLSILASVLVLIVAGVSLSALKENQVDQTKQVKFLPAKSQSERPSAAAEAMPSRGLKEVLALASKLEAKAELNKSKQISRAKLPASMRDDVITEESEIPFTNLEYEVDWLDEGQSQITLAGRTGLVKIYYETFTRPGGHIEKVELEREVILDPVRQEVAVGKRKPIAETKKTEPVSTTAAPAGPTAPSEPKDQTPAKPPVSSDIQKNFVRAGGPEAAAHNFSLISSLLQVNGQRHYGSFTDNGDGTITVDGQTFAYSSKSSNQVSGYDGASEYLSTSTASGLPTARGIVAVGKGGYPMGTVLFIEDFGLVVVADLSGMGPDHLDVCFNNGELIHGGLQPGNHHHNVYLLSMP